MAQFPQAISPRIKPQEHEAYRLSRSSAKVKNSGSKTPLLHTSSWVGD
jgi:hypothetical protein